MSEQKTINGPQGINVNNSNNKMHDMTPLTRPNKCPCLQSSKSYLRSKSLKRRPTIPKKQQQLCPSSDEECKRQSTHSLVHLLYFMLSGHTLTYSQAVNFN